MTDEDIIIITDDDLGHAKLVQKNLERADITNDIIHFKDGQELLNFLFTSDSGPSRIPHKPYIILLDIRMPRLDGIEVLKRIKADELLRKIPVIMLTTTDDPKEVDRCHSIGCSHYLVKPVDYGKFSETIKQLGQFLKIVEIPVLNGA
jgi:CheY-like chemotaxis protein